MSDSQTGGEILSDIPSSELHVYTRNRYFHNNRDHSSNPKQGQSSPPQVSHSDNPGIFSSLILSIDKPTDFDIHIALGKELELVPHSPLLNTYPIIDSLIIIKLLHQIFLICLFQEPFRRLWITQIGN